MRTASISRRSRKATARNRYGSARRHLRPSAHLVKRSRIYTAVGDPAQLPVALLGTARGMRQAVAARSGRLLPLRHAPRFTTQRRRVAGGPACYRVSHRTRRPPPTRACDASAWKCARPRFCDGRNPPAGLFARAEHCVRACMLCVRVCARRTVSIRI